MNRRRMLALLSSFQFLLLSAALASGATNYQVGVSPPTVDLGTVEPGTIYNVRFNVVTPSEEPLLVNLDIERSNLDFFVSKYPALLGEYSEEDPTGWVRFVENPVQLSVADSPQRSVSGERLGWREVGFLLQIPQGAEPGYHSFKVNPIPSIPQELGQGAESRLVAISSVRVVFRVPGYAVREGVILDVVQDKYVGSGLRVNTYFRNTGTVTVSATASQSFSRNGTLWQDSRSPVSYLRPGETAVMPTTMNAVGAEYGEYGVNTTVSYTTGSAFKASSVSIDEKPAEVIELEKPAEQMPAWAVIAMAVAVITISILIYKWYR